MKKLTLVIISILVGIIVGAIGATIFGKISSVILVVFVGPYFASFFALIAIWLFGIATAMVITPMVTASISQKIGEKKETAMAIGAIVGSISSLWGIANYTPIWDILWFPAP